MAEIAFPASLAILGQSAPEYVTPSQYVHRALGGQRMLATLDDNAGLYQGRLIIAGFDSVVGGRLPSPKESTSLEEQYALNYFNNRLNDGRNYLALPLMNGDNDTVAVVNTPSTTDLGTISVTRATYNQSDQQWQITLSAMPTVAVGQYVSAMYQGKRRLLQVIDRVTGAGGHLVFAPSLPLTTGTTLERATEVHVEKLALPTLNQADIQAVIAGEIRQGATLNWIERI